MKRRFGNPAWDGVVRGSGLLSLAAIPVVVKVPQAAIFTGFALVTIWLNGPISPFLPAAYEPVLVIMGRLYSPVLIAVLGTAATMYVELLNYKLYEKVVMSRSLNKLRDSGAMRTVLKLYRKAPFLTIWLAGLSIIPMWTVRLISPMAGYSTARYMLAAALGRLPKLWIFAALGAFLDFDLRILFAISALYIAVMVTFSIVKRRKKVAASTEPPATVEFQPEGHIAD